MERTDLKNEKNWLGKVGRTDPKKREGLTRKLDGLTQKMGRSDSKHGRSELKHKSAESKHGRSVSKQVGHIDTSQPSYKPKETLELFLPTLEIKLIKFR